MKRLKIKKYLRLSIPPLYWITVGILFGLDIFPNSRGWEIVFGLLVVVSVLVFLSAFSEK